MYIRGVIPHLQGSLPTGLIIVAYKEGREGKVYIVMEMKLDMQV